MRLAGGQATVEVVALIALVVAVAAAALSVLLAGAAAERAAAGAHAAAVAALQDRDPEAAARSAAGRSATVKVTERAVSVTVRAPVPLLGDRLKATAVDRLPALHRAPMIAVRGGDGRGSAVRSRKP